MKKLLGILLALLLALPCAGACAEDAGAADTSATDMTASLAAMISGDPAPTQSEWDGSFIGHWEAVGMGADGSDAKVEFMGMPTSVLAQLDINDDGTYTLTPMGTSTAGKWEITSEGLMLTPEDGEAQTATMQFGQLKLDLEGINGYFAKGKVEVVSKVPTESPWNGEIVGKWVCIGMDAGMGYVADNLGGIPAAMLMTIELSADGTASMQSVLAESDATGTWEGTPEALSVTTGGEPKSASIINGQMVFPMSETSFILLAQQ